MAFRRSHPGLAGVMVSHYGRYPFQFLGLLVIVTLAVTLWSGVTTLTGQARASLDRSQAALEPQYQLLRTDGALLTQEDFAHLRRQGLCVTPRLTVRIAGQAGQPRLELIGIDPLSSGCLGEPAGDLLEDEPDTVLLEPRLWGNQDSLDQWQRLTAELPRLPDTKIQNEPEVPRNTLIGDIGLVSQYRTLGHAELQILGPSMDANSLPPGYRTAVIDYGVASDDLAASFLLNLDALGVLVLLVAALLIRSVYVFGLNQRQQTLKALHRYGVRSRTVTAALAVELLAISALGASLGLLLGVEVAAVFSNGVRATLSGLFSVDIGAAPNSGPNSGAGPGMADWIQSAALIMGVTLWACADQLWRSSASGSRGGLWGLRLYSLGLAAALAMASVGGLLVVQGQSLWQVYLGTGLVLGGLALWLPRLIIAGLRLWQARTRSVEQEWSLSEMCELTRSMTLPLIALSFAIAASIGVYSMVNSFEATFSRWLNQRLQGDLYLTPERLTTDPQAALGEWTRQLNGAPGISVVHPVLGSSALVNAERVDLMAVDPGSPLLRHWSFIAAVAQPWQALSQHRGIFINEQLARRGDLGIGESVSVQLGERQFKGEVLAIYADYGRPLGEVLVPLDQVDSTLPDWSLGFALVMDSSDRANWPALENIPGLPAIASIRQQHEIKKFADDAFAQTFAITQALSGLTLMLSGLALALIGYTSFRLRSPLYSLVHVFGLSVHQVRLRLVGHAAGLTLMLALLAVPLGVLLSWILVARINPLAFGWALPFDLYPGFWLFIVCASALVGLIVGLLIGNPIRLAHLQHNLAIVAAALFLGGCGPAELPDEPTGFSALGSERDGFIQPAPGMTIEFPAAMGSHPAYRLEWWYLTANLKTADGERFGVQWTLFRQSLRPVAEPANAPQVRSQPADWSTQEVWMAHAAVSRPDGHLFSERMARGGSGQAGVETEPFSAWLDNWQMREVPQGSDTHSGDRPAHDGAPARHFEVRAKTDEFSYHLTLTRSGPPVFHGERGFSAKSPSGHGSMYFSFPDLQISGVVEINGNRFPVEGQGWFDREWSSQLLAPSQEGWDWFSLHLDDGRKLMAFQLRGDPACYSGTLIGRDGRVMPLASESISLQVVDQRETVYGQVPTAWRLRIPEADIDLQIQSWPGDHWNSGAYPYWEGPVQVSGSHQGEGFVELTGYHAPADE